jgi:hypothetical protein
MEQFVSTQGCSRNFGFESLGDDVLIHDPAVIVDCGSTSRSTFQMDELGFHFFEECIIEFIPIGNCKDWGKLFV